MAMSMMMTKTVMLISSLYHLEDEETVDGDGFDNELY
jgi:hypothetical protein